MKLSVEDIEKMNNDELIDEYEKTCIDYVNLGKEIYVRTIKEIFTNEESEKVKRINMVMNTNLYDFACEVGHKNDIKNGVESYVNEIASDENR